MRVNFLFWNLRSGYGKQLLNAVTCLAKQRVDVFLFAEAQPDPRVLLGALNSSGISQYYHAKSFSDRVLFFSSLGGALWTDRFLDETSDRLVAQELQLEGCLGILVVGAHLKSALHLTDQDRASWARALARDIQTIERDVGHHRTVLVGDLNMNPFDEGLVETEALHAVMTRELAVSVSELDSRKGFPVFYNPMWSCLGDRPAGRADMGLRPKAAAGTFFFNNTDARANRFWQLYDQVLVRPELMDQLKHVEILELAGEIALVTKNGRPRSDSVTDHLPIRFELDL